MPEKFNFLDGDFLKKEKKKKLLAVVVEVKDSSTISIHKHENLCICVTSGDSTHFSPA